MAEGGRAIIHDQKRINGPALPNKNPDLFVEALVTWHLYSYRLACNCGTRTVIFDRGLPDVIGVLMRYELPIPAHIRRAAEFYRYNDIAFIAPPWPEIYGTDAEREETADEAALYYDCQLRAYSESGYRVLEVPRDSVENRVDWLLRKVRQVS
jgi:predicted ATPase